MIPTLIVVFREVLEASLVLGIILAASRGVRGRARWVAGGSAAGVAGAVVVAVFAGEISSLVQGSGQELFNAAVLFAAVVMLGWHNIWMSRHGRELAADANRIGKQVLDGTRPLHALAIVCGVALLREGSEVVLFLSGILLAGDVSPGAMVMGGLLGVLSGAAVGAALYFGLAAIPMRHVFRATSLLLLLLSAGLAAQGASFLAAAGLLPALGESFWDTSGILSEGSIIGQILHVLVGYTARPQGIQLVFYTGTLLIIGTLMRLARVVDRPRERSLPVAPVPEVR